MEYYAKDLCPVCKKESKQVRYKTCLDCYINSLPDSEKKEQLKQLSKKIASDNKEREQEKIEYDKWRSVKENARECDKDENGKISCIEYWTGDCLGNDEYCWSKFYNRNSNQEKNIL